MSLKDFDYKRFFFDYGEKIGLATAGVVAVALGVWLIVPGSGLFARSAEGRAKDLQGLTATVSKGLDRNTPDPNDPNDSPPQDKKERLVAFAFDVIPDATIEQKYRIDGLFEPRHGGPGGRQMPTVKAPKEAGVALVHFQLPGLVYSTDGEWLMALKGLTGTTGPGGTNPNPGGSAMPAMPKMPSPGGSSGGFSPQGQMAGRLAQMYKRRGLIANRKDPDPDKAERDYEISWVKLDDKLDQSSLATQPIPIRAVEIAASFPYQAQIDEFMNKLGLPSEAAVLYEPSAVPDKDEKGQDVLVRSFRFLGVQVQRRSVDALGRPINDQGAVVTTPDGGWEDVDLQDAYATNIVLSGGVDNLEPETRFRRVAFPGLTLRKLPTLGDKRQPPVDEYPNLEDKLTSLKQTVDDLDKTPAKDIAKPAFTQKPGDVFGLDPTLGGGPAGTGPGGSVPPMPLGSSGKFPPPGMSIPPGGTGGPGSPTGEGALGVIPKYVLVRLFDFNIEPGKTYEYRMRVRMANPNYGHKDVASQGIAIDRELNEKKPTDKPVDNDKDFYVLPAAPDSKEPMKVTVSPDLFYYALDQAKLDDKDPKIKEKEKDKDKDAPPKLPLQPVNPATQTVLQIQKWVDFLTVKRIDYPIGDWVIAERVVATRGEPIGRQRVEVPYWRRQQDRFTMAADQTPKAGDKKYVATVDVPFVPDGKEPILVDFTGGDKTYARTHPKADDGTAPPPDAPVADKAPEEVLIYTADGKLLSRNATRDAADPDRINRLKDDR